MTRDRAWAWGTGVCIALSVSLSADTIVLRDGRRVQGRLVSIRDGVVELEAQRGLFAHERIRFDQDEVARIDFDGVGGQQFDGSHDDGAGGGSSRPSGMRERSVVVSAASQWTDTGIAVRSGQAVYFSASGKVKWGPGRQDGPGGERNSPRNDGRPMPDRPAAALIGRIGESDDYFFIGAETGAIRVRGSGRLYLRINDDYLPDNSGSFRVTTYY